MNLLSRISISVLIAFFVAVGLSYGQHTAEQISAKGVEYAADGKFQEAKQEFEKALKVDPLYEPAKEALEVIEDVVDQKIKSKTAIHLFKGQSYREKEQWDEAIAEYNIALEIDPKFTMAYNDRGIAYRWKGQHDQAISDHNKALDLNPRYVRAYISRGITYGVKGELDLAISDFSKALEINPRDADSYFSRGIAYGERGQCDKAISDYTKAIELNPRDAYFYRYRGLAYYHKGQYDQAISDYTKAIEIDPRDDYAYNFRGHAYLDKGQHDRAISDFTKAIEINPRDAYTYNNRGLAYFYKKEHEKAWDDFQKARNLGYQIHLGFLKDIGVASGRHIGHTMLTPKKEIVQNQARSPKGVYLEFRTKMEKCTTLEVFCNLRENYWTGPKGYNCEEIQINPDVDSMLRYYLLSKGLFPPSKIASIREEIDDNGATLLIKRLDSSHKATISMIKEDGGWKIEAEEIGIDMSAFGAISGIGKALMGKDNLNNLSINLTTLMLMEAAREGLTDTVLAYLAEGVFDINGKASNGSTALMAAAQEGHIDTVLTLLALGADLNVKANYGSTALKKAEERGHEKVFRLLKEAGAKD